ncbi:MAG TPA: hypothetical protein VGA52_12240, partial [Anaerolineales bacterium]
MTQRYRPWQIALMFLVVAIAVYLVLPSDPGIHLGPVQREVKVVRGLDLQGGLRVLLEADLPPEIEVSAEQMQLA